MCTLTDIQAMRLPRGRERIIYKTEFSMDIGNGNVPTNCLKMYLYCYNDIVNKEKEREKVDMNV